MTGGGYSALASVYDRLNRDVDYSQWADFTEECFRRFSAVKPSLVLDMGCGTGSMSIELAARGYDVTALDISPEMLSRAYESAMKAGQTGILFLEEDMCDFELYGTMGAVICFHDGINHLLSDEETESCFSLVHNYLDPGGLFIFDLNTPYKFREIYADNDYVLEDDGALCVWQNRLDETGTICDFHLSVFEQCDDGRYVRRNGLQSERCYDLDFIRRALAESGFELKAVFGGLDFSSAGEDCERWFVVASAVK